MAGTLGEAATVCRYHVGDTLIQCLAGFINSDDPIRGVREVLVRSISIQIVALASYGHLLSLQGVTNLRPRCGLLLAAVFLLFPEMAVAQLLLRILKTVKRVAWDKERLGIRFFLAACLGMHASPGAKSTCPYSSLLSLDPKTVVPIARAYNIVWMGRVGLLMSLLVQYIGSLVLWVRLVFFLNDRSYWHWHFDYRNFQMILGGLFAIVNSLGIMVLNQQWSTSPVENATDEIINNKIEIDDLRKAKILSGLKRPPTLYYLLKTHRIFTVFLDKYFPITIQQEFELSIVMFRILVHITVVHTYFRFKGGCPEILQLISDGQYTTACPDHINTLDPFTFTLTPRIRERFLLAKWLMLPAVLFNIAFARICLDWLAISIAYLCSPFVHPVANSARHTAMILRNWILSGRNPVSFLTIILIFSSVPFWIALIAQQCHWHMDAERGLKDGQLSGADKMAVSLLMWKDPWYDNLYVL